MFTIERENLILNLEKVRQYLCAYTPGTDFCDCKYGKDNELPERWVEEFNGCPEIRSCIG
jgi:hypothetical protein